MRQYYTNQTVNRFKSLNIPSVDKMGARRTLINCWYTPSSYGSSGNQLSYVSKTLKPYGHFVIMATVEPL